jgi:membrane protein DedA with SNARE-associated domain
MTSFISSAELPALIVLGIIQACCVPIPSEVTFGFAGVLASQGHGHLSVLIVIIVGTLAEMVGSYISFYVGWVGGKPLVNRLGRYVLVTESDVDRAERFLAGRGAWAVPVGRMTPFIRAVTSIVAGLVRIPPVKFGVLSLIGTAIYAAVITSIGYGVGSAWDTVNHYLSVAGYLIAALVVVALVAFVVLRYRQFKRESANLPGDGPAGGLGGPGSGTRRGRHSSTSQRN